MDGWRHQAPSQELAPAHQCDSSPPERTAAAPHDQGTAAAGELATIDAASLETGNARRDRHLRSPEFFDVVRHPYVRFESDFARLLGDTLSVSGELSAGGGRTEIELEARVLAVDAGYEIEAEVFIMHSGLGMTWNPLGISRPYSKLIVAGRFDPAPQPEVDAPRLIAAPRRCACGSRGLSSEIARRSCRR